MNTLQSHEEEFESGTVTESGYAAIADAEGYGAASSIGAGSVSINKLWNAFGQGKPLCCTVRINQYFSQTQMASYPSGARTTFQRVSESIFDAKSTNKVVNGTPTSLRSVRAHYHWR
jgi:hypothetical protein